MEDDPIQNYYEELVFDEIQKTLVDTGKVQTEDAIKDIACLALNRLPPRYIRHRVDVIFYMQDNEKNKILSDVADAVHKGYEIVSSNRSRED